MNVILVGFIIMAQTAGAGNIDSVYMPFGNMTECAKAKAFFEQEARKTDGRIDVDTHLKCMLTTKKGYSTGG